MLVNRYALNVQDHLTKFVHLKPLHSKEGAEVAKHLFWIFAEFGAPRRRSGSTKNS